ncbi:MAG: hypothetical protein K2I00_05125, partial [Ruminococcus sp.]|nr:hypothetical protein [Ruminococcus sp.]
MISRFRHRKKNKNSENKNTEDKDIFINDENNKDKKTDKISEEYENPDYKIPEKEKKTVCE